MEQRVSINFVMDEEELNSRKGHHEMAQIFHNIRLKMRHESLGGNITTEDGALIGQWEITDNGIRGRNE